MSATPFWETARAPADARPRLEGDRRADVIVVGGGLTGLSAALALARTGRRVVVLEAGRIGGEASGRNGGLVLPGWRREAAHLAAAFGTDAPRVWAMGVAAVDGLRALAADPALGGFDLALDGYLHAALTRRALAAEAAEAAEVADRFGDASTVILSREAIAAHVVTDRYVGGAFHAGGGWLHPLKLALGLARAAATAGAALHELSRVTALDDTPGAIVATTAAGRITAEFAVVATDAFAGAIDPALGRHVMPVWNYLVATEPLGDRLRELLPSGASVSDSRFVLDYYRPTADGRIVFGGGERYSPSPPRDIVAFVRPYLARVFPALAQVGLTHGWGGRVSVTMTRDPMIGRRGRRLWAIGYSGQGVVTAPFAGRLLADAIIGDAAGLELLARFPAVPFPGGPMARTPLYVAGMAWYALRDRLGLALEGVRA